MRYWEYSKYTFFFTASIRLFYFNFVFLNCAIFETNLLTIDPQNLESNDDIILI